MNRSRPSVGNRDSRDFQERTAQGNDWDAVHAILSKWPLPRRTIGTSGLVAVWWGLGWSRVSLRGRRGLTLPAFPPAFSVAFPPASSTARAWESPMRWLLAVLLALAMAGCAQPATTATPRLTIAASEKAVGDFSLWRQHLSTQPCAVEERVVRSEHVPGPQNTPAIFQRVEWTDHCYGADNGTYSFVYRASDMALACKLQYGLEDCYNPPCPGYFGEHAVGETWTVSCRSEERFHNATTIGPVDGVVFTNDTYKLVGYGPVAVAAGTFDAYHLQENTTEWHSKTNYSATDPSAGVTLTSRSGSPTPCRSRRRTSALPLPRTTIGRALRTACGRPTPR